MIRLAGALDAIHAGAVVVTEPSSGIAPLVPGEHLLVASAGFASLPRRGRCWATSSGSHVCAPERTSDSKRGSPIAMSVAVLRAAVVELVGEPVPSGATLGTLLPARAADDSAVPVTMPHQHHRGRAVVA